jgi:DUF3048 family protein
MKHTPRTPRTVRAIALLMGGVLASAALATGAAATTEPPDAAPTTTAAEPSTTAAEPSTTRPAPSTTRPAPTTTRPAPTTTQRPTTTTEVVRYPLTGLPVADPGTYTPRPALIVKIDNGVNSHPQTGLNQADLVYEEIVEGVTRFAAVFNSMDSDPVGNIRSGRTQDVYLFASFNDPIFAFSGGNATVNAALASTPWTLLTQGNGMFRVDGRGGAPYNLYGNTTDFFAQAGDAGDAVPQFQYGTQAGSPVTSIDLNIGGVGVNWAWDEQVGLFMRSENGSPHQLTDGQASTNNVVVLLVPYATGPAGGPEAQTIGTGDVVVYAGGLKTVGTWTRENPEDPFTLEAGGKPILLRGGRTWIELASAGQSTLTDDAAS